MAVQFEAVCGPKFVTFWDNTRDPLAVVNALDRLYTLRFIPKTQTVKVAVKFPICP